MRKLGHIVAASAIATPLLLSFAVPASAADTAPGSHVTTVLGVHIAVGAVSTGSSVSESIEASLNMAYLRKSGELDPADFTRDLRCGTVSEPAAAVSICVLQETTPTTMPR